MNLTIIEDQNLEKNQLILKCFETNEQIQHIKSYVENLDTTIVGTLHAQKYFFHPNEIYYFESVEKQTFLYSKEHVMKCSLRLYELEELLAYQFFIRISKIVLLNIMKIKSIHPLINRNLALTLDNDENVICSRRYADLLKKTLERR